MAAALHDISLQGGMMARKSAKQIVDEVVAKVKTETAPKKEIAKEPEVEHYYRCMVYVVPGSACNCYVSVKKN